MPAGTRRPDTEIEIFATNLPAFSIWQRCNKPVQMGFSGAVPVGVETVEIEAVCRVCDTDLTPRLLQQIRHLDAAYRDEVVDQLNKKQRSQK